MNDSIRLQESFVTVQGESGTAGKCTTFFRVVGCNLSCFYCDTGYAPQDDRRKIYQEGFTMRELLKRMEYLNAPYVCFTGGEPLMYAEFLYKFIEECKKQPWYIPVARKYNFETNGTMLIEADKTWRHIYDVVYTMDVKPFAYDKYKDIIHENLSNLDSDLGDEVKIVISSDSDLKLADELIHHYNRLEFILSPVHSEKENRFLTGDLVCDYIKKSKRDNVRVGVQLHKLLGQR